MIDDTFNDEWAKQQARTEAINFAATVEDATVEIVDEPTGRKHVELFWKDDSGSYHEEEGEAYGVFREYAGSREPTHYVIEWVEGARFDGGNGAGGANGANYKLVESPQMDGSYGENGDAIFFFTTSGEYVESSLDYVVSEEPRNINDEVILVDSPDNGDDSDENSTDS
jgi:hypothetical protein